MIRGSIVALVTPMHDDGSIDGEALDRLVDWHIEAGTDAIVAVGTTGESATLSVEEHLAVISQVVGRVAGRIPVIAGTGANATSEAIVLTQAAEGAGADACLSVVPYYNKPTQAGLRAHFEAIAKATSIPVILYNVPGRTGCDLRPETVAALSGVSGITGIKEASGTLERMQVLRERCGPEFAIYSGEDGIAAAAMLGPADGVVSVTANVAPQAMSELARWALAGDGERVSALDHTLQPLHAALFLESNPIPVKWAVHALGRIPAGIRLPLTPLSAEYHASVKAALAALEGP